MNRRFAPAPVFMIGAFAFVVLVLNVVGCKKSQVATHDDASAVSATIPLDQPAAATGAETQTIVKIGLTKDAAIMLNGIAVTEAELRAKLTPMREKNPDLKAQIDADGDVAHKHVIHLLDILKQIGIKKYSFGVAPSEKPSLAPLLIH